MDFKNWKTAILALDRYENGDDSKEFTDLINSIHPNEIKKEHIEFLLDTFSNDDDYGVQDGVFLVLEKAQEHLYFQALAEKFSSLIQKSSKQEWPLLILGRIVNSNNPHTIKAMLNAAEESKDKAMLNFINSSYFINNYPEVAEFL